MKTSDWSTCELLILDGASLSRLLDETRKLNALSGILNIPNNRVSTEILAVRPCNAMMRRANRAKI